MSRARIAVLLVSVLALLSSGVPAGAGAYPGVNGKIVYVAGDDVFTVNPDGTEVANLTQAEGLDAENVAASPDGKRFVFNVGSPTVLDDAGLYVMDMRGATIRNVLLGRHDDFIAVGAATWSPDGRRIAFEAYNYPGFSNELYVVDVDGTHLTKLTNCNCVSSSYPTWSPVGPEIAFVPCCSQTITTINADTKATTEVFTSESGYTNNLTWSPDGAQLAYDDLIEVYRVPVPNGTPVALTDTGPGYYSNPAWSPDGTKILVESNHASQQSNNRDIYAIDAVTGVAGGVERVTSALDAEGSPDWAPLCESRCTPTVLYLGKITKTARTVTVNGSIAPEAGGQVTVTLLRKTPAGMRPLGKPKQATISDERSRFTVTFPRPDSDICKIVARYPGDADHEGSRATKSFAC